MRLFTGPPVSGGRISDNSALGRRGDFCGNPAAAIYQGLAKWYNVYYDIIPSRIWFLRTPQKSRCIILPEGYHVRWMDG